MTLPFVSACGSPDAGRPVDAVLGLENAGTRSFVSGTIPEPSVRPGDVVIGQAANAPSQCVWRRANSARRFVADCPDEFEL